MSEASIDHLHRAREFVAVAESGDSKIEAYKKAAVEIQAAKVTQQVAADAIGKHQSWVQRLLRWYEDPHNWDRVPFGGPAENEARYARQDRRKVEQIAEERPEAIAEAITKATPEVQRRIADAIVRADPEPSLKQAAAPPKPTPAPGPSSERHLGRATFTLWEVSQLLLDEVPAGEAKVRMLADAEKAERLARGIVMLLDTGEIEAQFSKLLDEVGEAR